jgi:hypothetical protein
MFFAMQNAARDNLCTRSLSLRAVSQNCYFESKQSDSARRTLIRTFVKSERMIMQPANHTFGFFCQRAAVFLFA